MIEHVVAKNPLRQEGDPLADRVFVWLKGHPEHRELFSKLSFNSDIGYLNDCGDEMKRLHESLYVPLELDQHKLSFGVKFFQTYRMEILGVLGLYSLPYCYAGANGARVLILSKKITDHPQRRLLETASFVIDTCSADAFKAEGKGLVAALQVRMMHAAARYYAKAKIQDEIPVNQEDMLGTMLAFSLTVIRGLRQTGILISDKEAEGYLYLWKIIGQLIGVKSEYLPAHLRAASLLDKGIRDREFRRSEEGVLLAKSLVRYYNSEMRTPGVVAEDFMTFFLGSEMAEILDIRPSSPISSGAIGVGLRMQNFLKNMGLLSTGLDNPLERNLKKTPTALQFKDSSRG